MDIQLSAMRAFLDPTIYPAYMYVLVADHPQYRQLYAWVRGRWLHGNQASLLTDWKFVSVRRQLRSWRPIPPRTQLVQVDKFRFPALHALLDLNKADMG